MTMGIVNVSASLALAVHSLLCLAQDSSGFRSSTDLSQSLERSRYRLRNVSHAHLLKVLHRLTSYGLVASAKGPGGGFRIARPASEIRLIEIYEAIEGPHPVTRNRMCDHRCDAEQCLLGEFVTRTNDCAREYMRSVTLQDLSSAPKSFPEERNGRD